MKNGFSPERAVAAAAHGVDLTVNIDKDLAPLRLNPEINARIRKCLEDTLEKGNPVEYMKVLDHARRLVSDTSVDLSKLATSTQHEVVEVLDRYREKAPYEGGEVFRRI